ncbi:MAG TPA: sulfur transferase domain-containing protein [Verrucomicrobiae bacterium]|nr:sulfur transferase domain-containing protein [Verrucomicrobiae bacterium]
MRSFFLAAAALFALSLLAPAQTVTKENVDGIVNLRRLETTVACSGAIKPDTLPKIKQMGFVSVINLREPTEAGANVQEEGEAARAAGLRYYSIPFNSRNPDPAVAGKFLDAITARGSEPAYIHCAGGGRAATMWFIKRVVVDHWEIDRAEKEATDLGMTSPTLKQFAIDYAQSHKR